MAKRLLGPGLWALVIKVASAGLSYVMLVAFARMMDAHSYGEFGVMLNLAIVLATVAAMGLPTAVMRFWPGHLARHEAALAAGFHRSGQLLLLASSVSTIAVAAMVGYAGFAGMTLIMALLVALLLSGFAFGDYYANALRAQGRVLWSMVPRDIIWRICAPVLAGFLFWNNGDLSAVAAIASCVAVMLAVAAAQAIVSSRAAHQDTGDALPQTDWEQWRKPLLPLAAASILYAMVQQLDVVVVGGLVGQAEAGAYFAAQKTASLLGLVMIAGGLVAAPLMSAAFQAGKIRELQKLCKILALAIALTTAIGFFILMLIGKPLLGVFDPTYESAYPILVILAVGYGVDALAGPTAYLMQMTSLEGSYLRIMAIVYALVLALQFTFVPLYGAIAAAASTAFGVCLWNALSIYHLRKTIGVDSSILSFFLPPQQNNKTEP